MGNLSLVLSILICMILSFPFIETAPISSLISHLPGFNGTFPSEHYSGYVSLEQKHFFYYFVVSERNPSTDPVVLWLNGGPGCSSFDGFVYEHGPFNFQKARTKGSLPILHLNPYSWSKVASIIYLDSPVGVGYSYSDNKNYYKTGDLRTSLDCHKFLLKWFELYPEFLKNPFYISGESYAGIYVPTISDQVVKGIKAGVQPQINFKGYMVGNGIADIETYDSPTVALVPFAHGMGLISDHLFEVFQVACLGERPDAKLCIASLNKVGQMLKGLNVYNILEPCYHKTNKTKNKSLPISFQELGQTERPLKVRKRMFGLGTDWPFFTQLQYDSPMCINDEIASVWLNDEAVRKAMHSVPEAGRWELCSNRVNYTRYGAGSMIPYHKNLNSLGYRALIYSGDHDMAVPYTGTQAWVNDLGYKIVDEWRPWFSNHQVAGYVQGYANNLIFLTIKGAGHTVPEYKPRESLHFFSRWLEGQPI